jgi:hypothetical protein
MCEGSLACLEYAQLLTSVYPDGRFVFLTTCRYLQQLQIPAFGRFAYHLRLTDIRVGYGQVLDIAVNVCNKKFTVCQGNE